MGAEQFLEILRPMGMANPNRSSTVWFFHQLRGGIELASIY